MHGKYLMEYSFPNGACELKKKGMHLSHESLVLNFLFTIIIEKSKNGF